MKSSISWLPVELIGCLLGTRLQRRANDMDTFANGHQLLTASILYNAPTLRNKIGASFEYGMLVMPKLYEEDDYITTAFGLSFFGSPGTAFDIAYCAVIMDAMNWLSGNVSRENGGLGDDNLIDTFYGTVLTGTVANSPQDMSMLTLAREHLYVEFEWLNLSAPNDLRGALTKGQTIDDAKVAEIAAIVDSQLVDIMQFYQREI